MEQTDRWSLGADDRPYLPPQRRSHAVLLSLLALVLLALAAAYYYWREGAEPARPPAPAAVAPAAPAPPAAPQPPAVRYPLATPAAPEAGLPTLENSDSMLRELLSGLLGRKAFDDFVLPEGLVRRIVATVDNLPRPTAPRRMMPLNHVPGPFVVSGEAEQEIAARNAERYGPYVRVFERIDATALVAAYARAYPLFQRAYEELGYPGRYFNDRLVEAIDDMLAAPEPAEPPRVVRGRVLYEFADPDLETRSAGQKVLLRIGAGNAASVKAKLREIRKALSRA